MKHTSPYSIFIKFLTIVKQATASHIYLIKYTEHSLWVLQEETSSMAKYGPNNLCCIGSFIDVFLCVGGC